MPIKAIILAAGKGTRMKSKLPKVLHPISGIPMVQHVINTVNSISVIDINVVYGFGGDILIDNLSNQNIQFINQVEQLGTGHAIKVCSSYIRDDEDVMILYGDVPLTKKETLIRLVEAKPIDGISLLTVKLPNPTGYGRIMRVNGLVTGIVEQKDASVEQLKINECNTGILIANGGDLKKWIAEITNDNAQNEYYLTDIIQACHKEGKEIAVTNPDSSAEVEGANNRLQLATLEREYQLRRAHELMNDGASLLDPSRTDIRGIITVGEEVIIDINCIFEGEITLEDDVKIGANCIIKNSHIGKGTEVLPNTIIENAIVGENVMLGPFARIRPGTLIKENAKVGNFVEVKNTIIGENSKVGHLSYLGDAHIGANVNIGAGTITCNYDGVNKYRTVIEDGVFIGSNTSLIAPVTVSANSTTAAGSPITQDVEANTLAISRKKQINKKDWKRPTKNQKVLRTSESFL